MRPESRVKPVDPRCGHITHSGNFCGLCGMDLRLPTPDPPTWRCTCGAELFGAYEYCIVCGLPRPDAVKSASEEVSPS